MIILIQFVFSFVLVLIKRVILFLDTGSRTVLYLVFSFTLCATFIASANEIIDSVSPSALSNELIAAGFSYLPRNISSCANIVLMAELVSFLFNMKDKIYRYVATFIRKG
ncbi:hypothetical protein AOY57_13355 [Escherichia coli]|uniref:hypothetical protein n=1 Tax=Escherichia coli TaxID=562 RepID=UPI001918D8E1|nr:hypothetical protein [Escherichia coli]UMT23128.1 hypothetical protein AOY57_13315 [Escherichia coli]UMT23134.1 hypothetical protein AOY57_13355 [Escherichia coli]CAD6175483.1 Uncharacterised protein [Escherichia coli]